jgi:hypothetical protein
VGATADGVSNRFLPGGETVTTDSCCWRRDGRVGTSVRRAALVVAGEKPQPARIYPWEWAGEMRKSWDEFQTISAARETTSRGTKISEQTKQVCLKKGVKVEEPQTTVEQQTTRKIIKP